MLALYSGSIWNKKLGGLSTVILSKSMLLKDCLQKKRKKRNSAYSAWLDLTPLGCKGFPLENTMWYHYKVPPSFENLFHWGSVKMGWTRQRLLVTDCLGGGVGGIAISATLTLSCTSESFLALFCFESDKKPQTVQHSFQVAIVVLRLCRVQVKLRYLSESAAAHYIMTPPASVVTQL